MAWAVPFQPKTFLDAERQGTPGYDRGPDPKGCGFPGGDQNINLNGGAKGLEAFPQRGKRPSPFPTNVTVRQRNWWLPSEIDLFEDVDGGCPGEIPPSSVGRLGTSRAPARGEGSGGRAPPRHTVRGKPHPGVCCIIFHSAPVLWTSGGMDWEIQTSSRDPKDGHREVNFD